MKMDKRIDDLITEINQYTIGNATFRVLNSAEEAKAYNAAHNSNSAKLGDTVLTFDEYPPFKPIV